MKWKEVDIESIEAWWYIIAMGMEREFSVGGCFCLKVSIVGEVLKMSLWWVIIGGVALINAVGGVFKNTAGWWLSM